MAFPTDREQIEAAEQTLGVRLLPEHSARLLRDNGGVVVCGEGEEWQLHPVRDDSDRRQAARTSSHIVHETNEARKWVAFPKDAIAIANNGSGDLLVLRAGGDRIERWDHETGECVQVDIAWAED